MAAVTSIKGIPYPLPTDFADPRALRDLALYEDVAFAGYDVAFTAGPRPAAFLVRSGADATAIGGGSGPGMASGVTEWNTTGGTVSVSGTTWTQSTIEVPSWYMFGANMFTGISTGTATVGAVLQVVFLVTSIDPVTSLVATTGLGDGYPQNITGNNFVTESTETNTTVEYFTGNCIVPMYRGAVSLLFGNRDTGVQTKKALTGTTFWGIRLGAV